MKITLLTSLIIWITYMRSTDAEYRYKMRGPPPPPQLQRPHQIPQFHKKWHGQPPLHHMQRGQPRPRPIPHMHMNLNGPKPPLNMQGVKRPIPPHSPLPVASSNLRNVWKSPQTNKVNTFQTHQEKPFISSPSIPKSEYDFHVQTNNIPHHMNTIKQIDEKGPIHTIPAPKLSPADKPKIIEEVYSRPQHDLNEQVHTVVQIQKAHQYQVTEATDLHNKQHFRPHNDVIISDFEKSLKPQTIDQNIKFSATPFTQPQLLHLGQEQISQTELFKILNTYPQQQQLLDTYPLPILQQPQLQQHLTQQQGPHTTYLQTPQLFEQQVSYMTQIQHDVNANDKPHIQPEFHSFNYEEQGQKGQSRIDDFSEEQESTETLGNYVKNPMEALAQAQYVQHFFDTRDNSVARNNVEPDAKPSPQTILEDDEENSAFFTTLPSKKAADALATLQEAGKLNTYQPQAKQLSKQIPMTIYVPDENESEVPSRDNDDEEILQTAGRSNSAEYEDINRENIESASITRRKQAFGNRLQPKN